MSSDTLDPYLVLDQDPIKALEAALAREAIRRHSHQPEPVPALAQQIGGEHYKNMAIQPIEFSMANHLNACQHMAIKYIVRRKGDRLQDIDKAIHTLRIYRDMIEAGQAE